MITSLRFGRQLLGLFLLVLLSSTVALATNIATSITASVNPVNVGSSSTLTVSYTNTGSGNNTATAITRTLTGLPAGLTAVSFGGTDAANVSYNSGTGAVTINSAGLTLGKNGSNLDFTMTFTVPASASNFTAVSTFSATGPGGSPATDNVAITVVPTADVVTTLTGPSTVPNSTGVSFTVTYTNNGPSTASTVTRTVTVPTGATSIVATSGTVTGTGPYTITYPALGTLASAGTASFSFSYTSPATGTTMNTVSNITTTTSQNGATGNDQVTVTTALANASPFMGVTLASSANPINAGSALTLTVSVTNTGSGSTGATGVTRTVTGLPTGLTGVTFGGTGATGAAYNTGTGAVTFSGGSNTLAQGGTTLNFTISFTAPASSASFTALATVTATNQTNLSNATDTEAVTITPLADVATTLTGPTTSAQGGTVSFTVTYTNSGPSTAAGVTRTVAVPAGATSITATGGTVSGTGPFTITYAPSGGTMTSGQSDSFAFSYTAPTTGTTMNTVSNIATTTGQNGATANDQATVTTTLSPAADVSATVTAPATAAAGAYVSFSITVNNTSAVNSATNVVVSVQLATGLTTSEVSSSDAGIYDSATGIITFATRTLTVGQSFSPVVRVRMASTGTPTTRTAVVSATSDADPNAANNNGTAGTATATVTSTQVANIAIAISGPAGAVPGASLVYTVLLNNAGPSTATGVTAQLVLTGSPTGITVSSGTVVGSTVTFTVPGSSLTAGQAIAYTVRFTVPNSIGSSITGTTSATSTTTDGDPIAANNNGTAPASQVTTAILSSTPSEVCAIPGSSGSLTYTGTQNTNTYYPGTANAAAGQKTISIGTAVYSGTTGLTNLAVGDLVLVMQMQGADIDYTNTGTYGDGYTGDPGSGAAGTNLTAGQYEYGVVASVTGVSPSFTAVTLVSNLLYSYQSATATATTGQKTFQVIRVPQYQNFTLSANLTGTPKWNGSTGGVLALDVSGTMTLGGFKMDLAGKGFRGGAGRGLTGGAGATTDYRTANTVATNGSKGEGIVGTPRYVNNGGTTIAPTDLGAAFGYPDGTAVGGGDNGRGAPGNAGGGGTDTNPVANDENTGGGGGSNGGFGGQGGNGWQSNLPFGGFGGVPFAQAAPSRVVMGGGGGAGTSNNSTVDTGNANNLNIGGVAGNNLTANGFATSGAAGGGIVIARASNVSGTGTIDVSGADMKYVPLNDGSGGGGAGGSVVLISNNTAPSALTGITVLANGGLGGSNTGAGSPHGPGGGGSGGVSYSSSALNVASTYGAGVNGTTAGGITYEAGPGTSAGAAVRSDVGFDETPFLQSGANCVNDLTTTLSGPTLLAIGAASGPFTVTFTNTGLGSVGNYLTRTLTLPTGASLSAAQTTYLNSTYGLTGNGLNTGNYSTTGAGATAVTTISFGSVANQAYNVSASYTFFFTAPAAISTPSVGSALTVDPTFGNTYYTNEGGNVAPNSATLALNVVNTLVTGTVFEDVNYGGGLGRDYTTANTSATASGFTTGAIRRPGVKVELYNTSTGAYVASAITDANGLYTFPVSATTGYTVRVVNSSVTSVRSGATSTGSATAGFVSNQLAVQTYNGSTDRVGGEYPGLTSAPANTTSANLSTLTTGSVAAQSLATVTSGANNTTTAGPNFGFNFDLVVNTNDGGQGSVAQFVANANALGNEALLAQSGSRKDAANATQTLPAGRETSIFMISDGAAHNGLRLYNASTNPGLISQLVGGVASITTTSTLSLSGTLTALDGTTQTANVGDTNSGTATNALATTVGTDGVTLAGIQKSEVEISGALTTVLDVEATNTIVRGLALHGGSSQAVLVGNAASATGYLFENLLVGTTPAGIRPTTNISSNYGISLPGNSGSGTVQNSLIAFTGNSGLNVNNGTGTAGINQFLSNFFIKNGFTQAGGDGISFGDGGSGPANIVGNYFTNQNSSAIQFEIGSTQATTITNNSISNSGVVGDVGATVNSLEGGGIVYLQRDGTKRGSQLDVISKNVITGAQGAGVVIGYGQQNVTISQNNTNGNGGLGIDIIDNALYYVNSGNATGAADYGNGDGVTVNDGNNPATAATTVPNRGVDFPVFTSATIIGTNLVVKGFARPGAVIELFNPGTADASGFGEGQTYLGRVTEGGAAGGGNLVADTNAGTGSYGPATVNGLSQGTDATANAFTFTIPVSGTFAGYVAGSLLTATATLNNSTSEFAGKVNVNTAPVPNTLSNVSIPNTNGATVLSPNLSGTANGTFNGGANSIAYYTITGLPASGTLTYNGAAVVANTTQITPALLGTLTYTPVSGFTGGSVSFTYTATDANGATSTTNNNGGTITAGAATYTIPVLQVADVTTSIVASPSGSVNAGAALSFTVTLANNGPNTAAGYTQTLTLTAGLGTVTFPTLPAGVTASYNNGTGVVTFTGLPATLASGSNLNMVVNIAAVPAALASVNASTTIGTSTNQGADTGPNSASNTVTVTPVADVATSISASPTPVNAGTALSIPVVFINNGPSTAATVTRSVQLQAGLGVGNVTATNGGTYDNATGIVSYPSTATLTNGSNLNSTITITAVPASFATITATSTTSTTTSENGVTANNTATLSPVTVTPVADVYTTLTGPGTLLATIQSGNYTVLFGNNGPSTAAGVTRTVSIPANTASAVTTSAGGTITGSQVAGWTITYPGGSFATGTSNTYTFTLTPGALTTNTDIAVTSNTGTTTSQNGATANDASTVTYTVGGIADVTTTLTAPGTLLTGVQSGNYTVTYANNGPSTAGNVTRTVSIPANTASAVTSSAGGTVTGSQATGWTITYPGGSFASGNSVSYTFTLTPAAAVSGSTVMVTSNTSTTTPQGLNTGPDAASTTTAVTPVADVLTTVTGPTTIAQGQATGNYTVTFTNNGPSTASTIPRTLTLPTGATLSAAQVSNLNTTYGLTGNGLNTGSYATTGSGASAVTTINFGSLTTQASAGTASFVFAFTAPLTAGAASIVSNTSTTTSQNGATANDVSTLPLTVSPVADVTTTINGPTQLSTGVATGTYTVTYANVGSAAAAAVMRTLALPTGATLSAAQLSNLNTTYGLTGNGLNTGSYATTGSGASAVTTIDFGNVTNLAAGASASFAFTFTAPAAAGAVTMVSNTSTSTSEGTNLAPNSSTLNATVNAVADVAATITPITGTVAAGTAGAGFNVSFANNGALTPAAGVTQTVQLPAGLTTYGTVTATNGGTYNNTTGLVTYTPTPTTIANGTPLTSVITFTAPPSGPVAATATVTTTSDEAGQTANNTASSSLTITPSFDLTTTIYGPGTVVQGNEVVLNVTTTNNGPSASTATQTVQLIAGLTNVFVSNGGTYNSATGLVTFPALASLPSGQTVGNTISFTAPTAGTALAPVAVVTPNTTGAGETNITNNTAYLNGAGSSTNITITAPTTLLANVYTTVSATPQSVAAGSPVTVTVVQGNAGPTDASTVVERVQLLPGLTITTLPSGATYDAATGLLTLPTIALQASGASTSYTIVFTAPATAGNNGQILISASATTQTSETVLADNVASTVVTVVPTADVATTVTGPATASAGQPLTYTASFANNGPGIATGVTRTVQLPAGLGTVTILDVATGLAAGTYNSTTGLVTFTTLATQATGTSAAYTLSFVAPATNFTVSSATGATTPDGVPANNTASVGTTVASMADVAVVISAPATAVVGNPVTYFVTTTNNGPNGATGVATTLQLPTGLSGVTVSGTGSYNSGTGLVTFAAAGSMISGASVGDYVTFTMPNAAGGQLAGVATATSTSTDPIAANNSASTATSVAPITGTTGDVATTVSAPATSAAGASLTVTATFTNNGPNAATNVAPTLQLPAGLTGVVVSNSGTYNSANGVVTWPLIASQASANTVSYTAAFPAPATGAMRATSAVASQTSDNVPANNSATTTTTITTAYDAITSLSGPASSLPGLTNTYSATATNNGPSVAASVQQTVTLPSGVTATNISGGGTQTGTTITWPAIANMTVGTANAATYTFDIAMPGTGSLTLTANVSTGAGETNTTNNSAALTTTAGNQPPVAQHVVNSLQAPECSTAGQMLISPLVATDADGAVVTYQLTGSLPPSTQGVLYYNNNVDGVSGSYVVLPTGQALTPAQANSLHFDPATTYTGNVNFNYTATDNLGALSNVALYTIAVGLDNPAVYANTPLRGNTNPYVTNDIVAFVIDPNGARYTSAGIIYTPTDGLLTTSGAPANGLDPAVPTSALLTPISGPGNATPPVSNPTNTLPPGTALNPNTGQIYVSNASLLPRVTTATPYTVNITTTDVFGGVTTQPVTFFLGAWPLPVELLTFTAKAVRNVDGVLNWRTASEHNSDHWNIERSTNGRDFVKFAQLAAQGNKTSPTNYTLTDANAAKLGSTIYYRLQEVDMDSTVAYSPVQAVSFGKAATLAFGIYPNPAGENVALDLSALPTGTYRVSFVDMAGRTVRNATFAAGLTHGLDLHELASGSYIVFVQGIDAQAATRLTQRLVKN